MREYVIRTRNNYFNFGDLERNIYDIEDIAHALSKINRFTGHSVTPYSVGEHSLYVSELMAKDGLSSRLQLLGLIHDFHEAYVSDMASPLKWYLKDKLGFDFNAYSDQIDIIMLKKWDIAEPTEQEHETIKRYDNLAFEHERARLFTAPKNNLAFWKRGVVDPDVTASRIITKYNRLFGAINPGHDQTYIKKAMENVLTVDAAAVAANTTSGDAYVKEVIKDIVHPNHTVVSEVQRPETLWEKIVRKWKEI